MKAETFVAALALGLAATATWAASVADKEDAIAMVRKGVAYITAHGTEKGYAEISNKSGRFVDRDLYLVVYGLDGKCLAHGANEKQVGRELIDLTDIDGRYFIRERVALVRAAPAGVWHEYRFANPVSKKIEPKLMYCEKLGDTAVCGAVYR